MIAYELTNEQRAYFGLDPIEKHWDRVLFKGDTYRPDSILYYEGNTIKRHIISTENRYSEYHYHELTRERSLLLPKTTKGKEKKLTASVLNKRVPIGMYLRITNWDFKIANYDTQKTFYSSYWDCEEQSKKHPSEQISEFIEKSHESHLREISEFKNAKRKHVKFNSGDYFCFKLDRINWGFGRILLDVNKVKKKGFISRQHGLSLFMGLPVIVQLFAYKSITKNIEIFELDKQPKLPSDVMWDNLLLYGEYEIIGHRDLLDEEFEFPISYGKCIDSRPFVFLQWGMIHKELPYEKFNKYTKGEGFDKPNPYGYYGIGFRPHYKSLDIIRAVENKGIYDYGMSRHFMAKNDLRNPKNEEIKNELFNVFGLDPNKSYIENCRLTGTILIMDIIKQL